MLLAITPPPPIKYATPPLRGAALSPFGVHLQLTHKNSAPKILFSPWGRAAPSAPLAMPMILERPFVQSSAERIASGMFTRFLCPLLFV